MKWEVGVALVQYMTCTPEQQREKNPCLAPATRAVFATEPIFLTRTGQRESRTGQMLAASVLWLAWPRLLHEQWFSGVIKLPLL
jgi:hypothetical protein